MLKEKAQNHDSEALPLIQRYRDTVEWLLFLDISVKNPGINPHVSLAGEKHTFWIGWYNLLLYNIYKASGVLFLTESHVCFLFH